MFCQHCGKKLPLLQKFTGGEFCSEEHRDSYQREAERLALTRLIENPAQGQPAAKPQLGATASKAAPASKSAAASTADTNKANSAKSTAGGTSGARRSGGKPSNPLRKEVGEPAQRLLPLSWKDTARNGVEQTLAVPIVDLMPMGAELALGYFRGAKPRARLYLPVSVRAASHSPAVQTWTCSMVVWESLPKFRNFLVKPSDPATIEEIDWAGWAAEIAVAIERADAAPPEGGLLGLASGIDGQNRPAVISAHCEDACGVKPVLALPTVAIALAGSFGRGENPPAPPEPSRQLRLRRTPMTYGEAPAIAPLLAAVSPAAQCGAREGKLDSTDLPQVLTKPQWRATLSLVAKGLPPVGAVDVQFARATSSSRPRTSEPGQPIYDMAPQIPARALRQVTVRRAAQTEIPLPLVAGSRERVASAVALPADAQPFLEPPDAVPLAAPLFNPPLSSLRRLAVTARNPLVRRRLTTSGEILPVDYDAVSSRPPRLDVDASRSLRANGALPQLTEPAQGRKTPEGELTLAEPAASAPVLNCGSRKPRAQFNPSASRLYPFQSHRLVPRDGGRQLKSELNPLQSKGFIILSSSRLRLRTEEGEKSRRHFLPKLPQIPHLAAIAKWGAGLTIIGVAAIAVLFSGAPKAAGNIKPAAAPSAWDSLQKSISKRAAVALTDDFRGGLGEWMGEQGWGKSWSFDRLGFVRAGSLALYTPSMSLRDYRFEFLAQIEKKALSWVVRAADLENYQVVRLELSNDGPLPRAYVVRYPVVKGKRGKTTRKDLPLDVSQDMMYQVAMETRGADQVLTVQGQVVDSWTDPALDRGGIGFFSAPGEKARVRWVEVRHQYDMVGRLCAYLAPPSPGTAD